MTNIHPDHLRALLEGRAWRDFAVRASLLGGWLVARPPHVSWPDAATEMNAEQVKQRFKREGRTVHAWAREHGYEPAHVYQVLNGQLKGRYGKSYEIAVKLGMNPQK